MFGLSLLRQLSPKIILWLLYPITLVQLLVRFLTGTIYGALFVSVALYWLMQETSESRPYTFDQMLLWIDELDSSSKTAIATSVITILGFLVAFYTATHNWKQQAITNLKINAASGIERFYNEFSDLVIGLELDAKFILETFELARQAGINQKTKTEIEIALSKIQSFIKTRQRLSTMAIEVHGLLGRDYTLLGTVWGVVDALEDCAKAVNEVAQKMWVHVPAIEITKPDFYGQFVSGINPSEWNSLIECCDKNRRFVSATVGGVRGSLLAPLISANLPSLMVMAKKRSGIIEALSHLKKRQAKP